MDGSADRISRLLGGTPFQPVRALGRGAMGEVFVIRHEFLSREFALKVLHRPEYADRFRVEAEIMGRLSHPHIVEVVDYWVADDGRPCIVMELLQGWTLADELGSRGRLPVPESVLLTRQALSALGAAHELGIVHRDIKPENLFLHDAPGYGRVLKVLDFGIARLLLPTEARTPAAAALATATGALVGSPRFMSPEAARGERVDARADLYSVALVLYLMIAGTGAFDSGAMDPPPLALQRETYVPAELDAIILRALREDPSHRFPSARDFSVALRPFARRAAEANGAPA